MWKLPLSGTSGDPPPLATGTASLRLACLNLGRRDVNHFVSGGLQELVELAFRVEGLGAGVDSQEPPQLLLPTDLFIVQTLWPGLIIPFIKRFTEKTGDKGCGQSLSCSFF